MIDVVISLTQSLNRCITISLTLAHSHSLSLSLSLTLLEYTTSGSPSDDHCCPMSGKQFRYCCYSDDDDDRDADDVMMMIDVFHLTHSITHSLSHPSYLLQSLSLAIFALTLSCSLSISKTCRNHDFWQSIDSSLLSVPWQVSNFDAAATKMLMT